MQLETGWNHCTFKAEDAVDRKLLLKLFNNLDYKEELVELSRDSSELIISELIITTYF